MTNTTVTKDDGVKLVSDFHGTIESHNKACKVGAEQFKVATRKRLAAMLSEGYNVALALTADEAVLGELCSHYGTNAPKAGENLFSPVIRILFGKKNKATGKLEASRSTWKYGLAYRAAQTLGWKAGEFATKLDAYELEVSENGKTKKLKGLIALETFDRRQHGLARELKDEDAVQLAAISWMAKKQVPLATVAGPFAKSPQHKQMVGLIAQYDAPSGLWKIQCVNQADSDRAWGTISKAMVKEYQAWVGDAALQLASEKLDSMAPDDMDELLEQLEKHNREVDSQNALATLGAKLTVFETDGELAWPEEALATGAASTSSDADGLEVA